MTAQSPADRRGLHSTALARSSGSRPCGTSASSMPVLPPTRGSTFDPARQDLRCGRCNAWSSRATPRSRRRRPSARAAGAADAVARTVDASAAASGSAALQVQRQQPAQDLVVGHGRRPVGPAAHDKDSCKVGSLASAATLTATSAPGGKWGRCRLRHQPCLTILEPPRIAPLEEDAARFKASFGIQSFDVLHQCAGVFGQHVGHGIALALRQQLEVPLTRTRSSPTSRGETRTSRPQAIA